MPVTSVSNDAATQMLTAEFDAPIERAWQLYADPRQLEQWLNSPGYPLTISDHDLSIGGFVPAHVTTPDGHRSPTGTGESPPSTPRAAWSGGTASSTTRASRIRPSRRRRCV